MLVSTIVRAENTSYYVDTTGSDSADGRSEKSPWKTLNRVNRASFSPGDKLLFKAGQRWEGQLKLHGSGTPKPPSVLGATAKERLPISPARERKMPQSY